MFDSAGYKVIRAGVLVVLFGKVAICETAIVPFTVHERISYRDGHGHEACVEQRTYAVRSDGSDVRIVDRYVRKRDEWARFRFINDTAAMKRRSVDLFTESVTTYPMNAREVQLQRQKVAVQCSELTGQRAEILGYEVFREQTTGKGANEQTVETEAWKAPRFNCYPLRLIMRLRDAKGELKAENVQEALTIVPGEPDPTLFFVSPGYRERSPSEVMQETNRRKGGPTACPECQSEAAQNWDKVYAGSRAAGKGK